MDLYLSSKVLWDKTLPEVLRLVSDYEYDGIELWYEHFTLPDHPGYLKKSDVLDLITSNCLPLWIHGPTMDINVTSVNPRIASASLEENLDAIEFANKARAKGIVVHPGRLSTSSDDPELYWEKQMSFLDRVTRAAHCRVALENMDNSGFQFVLNPEDLDRIFARSDSSKLGICLDIAHAASLGNLNDFLEKVPEDITHFHYSNLGRNSGHKPIDKGKLNLTEELVNYLDEFEGVLTFEGWDPGRGIEVAQKTKDLFLDEFDRIKAKL